MISQIEVNDSWINGEHIIAGFVVEVGFSCEGNVLKGIGKVDNLCVAIIGDGGIGEKDGVDVFVDKVWYRVFGVGLIISISLLFID